MQNPGTVYSCDFDNWRQSLRPLLRASGVSDLLRGRRIIIKPNLVEPLLPPITTPVELVAELVDYLQDESAAAEIIIAEGSGAINHDTWHVFRFLGYSDLARRKKVKLLDLNEAELVVVTRPGCRRWPEMHLPRIVFDSYLISVPVLKAHSLAGVTLTMKNMMGLAPPAYYQEAGSWKKASFHEGIQDAILDLNRYRTPDFTVMDATVGMQEAHLWGPTCKPPPNKLLAGFDPVAIDACGAGLLKRNWSDIGHLRMAHNELGRAAPLNLVELS